MAGTTRFIFLTLALLASALSPAFSPTLNQASEKAKAFLEKKYGRAELKRIERGLRQARLLWRKEDGGPDDFYSFATTEFLPMGKELDLTFQRMEFALERADGYLNSLGRDWRRGEDLETGPPLKLDLRLAGLNPGAHLAEDLFRSKIAFVVLLNFRGTTLQQRLAEGGQWTRRQWAETRLAQRFLTRGSAEADAKLAQAYAKARSYVGSYNIFTHNVLTKDGRRLFPVGQRLLSHWNLRDEIKACYGSGGALEKQRLLARVMDAIVQQTIPAAAIDNAKVDWTPGVEAKGRENDERYRRWLAIFQAERFADKLDPLHPTFMDRRFARDSETPEGEVQRLFESVLSSPLSTGVAKAMTQRLGRKLEPFDIYYPGFASQGVAREAELNLLLKAKYPSAKEFADDIPRMLRELGFAGDKADFLASRIVVEPARGSGHALAPFRRDDNAYLRTRFEPGGMNYKGYNIAVHEMGHNVEQLFSTVTIDHSSLRGVPNNSFTEALAFVFQSRDLKLLGLSEGAHETRALNEFWETRQIAGAALVDMAAWRWLYSNPKATPAQFRKAVVRIAKDVWNRFYAKVFGVRDSTILAIYSHMVDSGLYLPDYALARLIAFQIERHFERRPIGPEFERLARIGCVTPDAWMREGLRAPLSASAMLTAVEQELERLGPG